MTFSESLQRRRFIVRTLSMLAAACATRGPWAADVPAPSPAVDHQRVAARLVAVRFSRPDDAARMGGEYRKSLVTAPTLADLVEQFLERVPGLDEAVAGADDEHLDRVLEEAIRGDFEQANVVRVKGWVLSRSEADLALLALLVD